MKNDMHLPKAGNLPDEPLCKHTIVFQDFSAVCAKRVTGSHAAQRMVHSGSAQFRVARQKRLGDKARFIADK
jgi:hypothetical protein